MGWFGPKNLNQTVTLTEGTDIVWEYSSTDSAVVSLDVQRIEGEGVDVYCMTPKEYKNYKNGLLFKYITQLSYEDIDTFSNNCILPSGKYFLVARLQRLQDGWESKTVFNIRFEQLQ